MTHTRPITNVTIPMYVLARLLSLHDLWKLLRILLDQFVYKQFFYHLIW
jgi:hypothetical protein